MQTKIAARNRKKKVGRNTASRRPLTGADIRRMIAGGRKLSKSKRDPRVVKSPWADEVIVFVSSQKEGRQLPQTVTVEGKQYALIVQKKTAAAAIRAVARKLGLRLHDLTKERVPAKDRYASPFAEERRVVRRAELKQKPTARQIRERAEFLASLNAASI